MAAETASPESISIGPTGGDREVRVSISRPTRRTDMATIAGLVLSFGMIGGAILIGRSDANFFNIPALMIVVFGTMAVTSVSYSVEEIRRGWGVIRQSMIHSSFNSSQLARELIDLSVLARKKGLLAISAVQENLGNNPFLYYSAGMVTDGYQPEEIRRLLAQEIDAVGERHRRAAGMLRRAADIAPAMGLIGTLVGLVQMLANLEDPSSIGPAMAVALLTTFYGAILGTVVLSPLAAKLERNSGEEILNKGLVMTAMISIAAQDNPRRLEMLLNSELPPEKRITYFD